MKVLLLLLAGVSCGLLTYIAIQVSQPTTAAAPQILPLPLAHPVQELELALDLHITLDEGRGTGAARRAARFEPRPVVTASAYPVATLPRMESFEDGTLLKEYHPNGQLALLGARKLDEHDVWIRHGAWQSWHENGQADELGAYAEGVEDGPWQWWWPNGVRKAEGRFHQGKREGEWTFWHDNGQLLMQAHYLDGEGSGHWTAYHENGLTWTDGDYEGGKISGRWRVWDDTGLLDPQRSGVYRDGEKIGQ